jgi:hypothetical protein
MKKGLAFLEGKITQVKFYHYQFLDFLKNPLYP